MKIRGFTTIIIEVFVSFRQNSLFSKKSKFQYLWETSSLPLRSSSLWTDKFYNLNLSHAAYEKLLQPAIKPSSELYTALCVLNHKTFWILERNMALAVSD